MCEKLQRVNIVFCARNRKNVFVPISIHFDSVGEEWGDEAWKGFEVVK